jgi:hypothetical protein
MSTLCKQLAETIQAQELTISAYQTSFSEGSDIYSKIQGYMDQLVLQQHERGLLCLAIPVAGLIKLQTKSYR